MRTFIVPREEVEFRGNWDVMGLRATGSVDYTITDVFVPASFTHTPDSIIPERGGSLFTMGILGLTQLGHTGFAIGVGRRVLDELGGFVRDRTPLRGGRVAPLADTEGF